MSLICDERVFGGLLEDNRSQVVLPEEFKKKVKEMFPDSQILYRALETGNIDEIAYWLKSKTSIPNEEVIGATSLQELKDKAMFESQKRDLQSELFKIIGA